MSNQKILNIVIILICVLILLLLVEKFPRLCVAFAISIILILFACKYNFLGSSNIYDLLNNYREKFENVINISNTPKFDNSLNTSKYSAPSVLNNNFGFGFDDKNIIQRDFSVYITPDKQAEYETKVPELIAYKDFVKSANNLIDMIITDDKIQQKYLKLELQMKIMRLYYTVDSVVTSDYFPQHNYVATIEAEREIKNTIHNLIYLGISDNEESIQSQLLTQLDKLNADLNAKLINIVNTKNGANGIYSTSGFLPSSPYLPSGIMNNNYDMSEDSTRFAHDDSNTSMYF